MSVRNLSNLCHYIGLDLAWSARNRSGIAVLVGGPAGARLVEDPQLLDTDAAILAYIDRHAPIGPAIIAIDAPLVVPNEHGRRQADALLSAAFRRYEAGTHPANRRLLARDGIVRGEALTAAFAA
ncbi:MAG: DUF429 domain-containing protein [Oscillochloris sp.]|nr:DUF429 domain-containing protein [Oscillochloris sp.]